MSRQPAFPSVGSTPEQQRLLAGVRDFVQETLVRAGLLRAPQGVSVIRVASGVAAAAAFGTFNQCHPPYDGVVFLPQMRPETINQQLYVAKAVPSGVLRFVAAPNQNGTVPLINGASGFTATGARRLTFMGNGTDWFV